jgi:hypothetical protein
LIKDDTPEERLERMESILATQIRLSGPDGGPASKARADVAYRLEALGRFAEARLLRQEVLEANRHHMGEEHPYTLSAELWLAANLQRQNMSEESRRLLVHVYEVRRTNLGPENPETVEVERILASIDGDENV